MLDELLKTFADEALRCGRLLLSHRCSLVSQTLLRLLYYSCLPPPNRTYTNVYHNGINTTHHDQSTV